MQNPLNRKGNGDRIKLVEVIQNLMEEAAK